MSSWKYAWRYHWKVFNETIRSRSFWLTLLGICAALLVWIYLFYLTVKNVDSSRLLYSKFCANDQQRNRHLFAIAVLTPVFIVGLIGVLGEWMRFMDNRRDGRPSKPRDLFLFIALMLGAALLIAFALHC